LQKDVLCVVAIRTVHVDGERTKRKPSEREIVL